MKTIIDVFLKNGKSITIVDETMANEPIVRLASELRSLFDDRLFGTSADGKGFTVINVDEVTHFTVREVSEGSLPR